jgi:hypothetical protein
MALKLAITDHPDAYHVVTMAVFDKVNGNQMLVTTWHDQAARLAGEAPVAYAQHGSAFVADLAADNPIEHAYLLLKTLPDFDGAVDA